jgi:hypothetical protein
MSRGNDMYMHMQHQELYICVCILCPGAEILEVLLHIEINDMKMEYSG